MAEATRLSSSESKTRGLARACFRLFTCFTLLRLIDIEMPVDLASARGTAVGAGSGQERSEFHRTVPAVAGTTNQRDILDRVFDKGLVIAGQARPSLMARSGTPSAHLPAEVPTGRLVTRRNAAASHMPQRGGANIEVVMPSAGLRSHVEG
jgi:hypothetical protein